jgi:hypothetical protein
MEEMEGIGSYQKMEVMEGIVLVKNVRKRLYQKMVTL